MMGQATKQQCHAARSRSIQNEVAEQRNPQWILRLRFASRRMTGMGGRKILNNPVMLRVVAAARTKLQNSVIPMDSATLRLRAGQAPHGMKEVGMGTKALVVQGAGSEGSRH